MAERGCTSVGRDPLAGALRPVRFVALGDSVTEGLGDPVPGGGWRGWAWLLAHGLGERDDVAFVNLASSGATTERVVREQLPAALGLAPTMASVLVGVNDVLRRGFDPDAAGARLETTVATLRGAGAVVLTARMPDPGRMLRLPGALRRPLARRTEYLNAVVEEVAGRYGTVHVDLATHPATSDRTMWHVDRLHPNERGHRAMARAFAAALDAYGRPVYSIPAAEPVGGIEGRALEHIWWLATRGTGWVVERCTDLVPYLAGLAVHEVWATVTGRRTSPDARPGPGPAEGLGAGPAEGLGAGPPGRGHGDRLRP